jgi:hypothetical protein
MVRNKYMNDKSQQTCTVELKDRAIWLHGVAHPDASFNCFYGWLSTCQTKRSPSRCTTNIDLCAMNGSTGGQAYSCKAYWQPCSMLSLFLWGAGRSQFLPSCSLLNAGCLNGCCICRNAWFSIWLIK